MQDFYDFMDKTCKAAAEFEKAGGDWEELRHKIFDQYEPTINIENRSPLGGWLGGKFFLANRIIPLIPPHKRYVEPFWGAAWVFFKKPRSEMEILNDMNGDIINFYDVIQNHLDDFLKFGRNAVVSRQLFDFHVNNVPSFESKAERAWQFFYVFKNIYGGNMDRPKPSFSTHSVDSIENQLATVKAAHRRLQKVLIEKRNYDAVISQQDGVNTFFYVDPPYIFDRQYYKNLPFRKEDHYNLSVVLRKIKGKFLLSYNDCDLARDLYKDFNFLEIGTKYGIAVGTISKTAKMGGARELLISNYDWPQVLPKTQRM